MTTGAPRSDTAGIDKVDARDVLLASGYPAVEVIVTTVSGAAGTVVFVAERGAQDPPTAADVAVAGPTLEGMDAADQREIDGTLNDLFEPPQTSYAGARGVFALSLAVARAAAASLGVPLYRHLGGPEATALPVPLITAIDFGACAAGGMQFQRCMIVPLAAESFADALRCGSAVFDALGALVRPGDANAAAPGAFAPRFAATDGGCELLARAIEGAGYRPGSDAAIAIDPAASAFFHDGRYYPHTPQSESLDASLMVTFYDALCRTYPVVSIHDALAATDPGGWRLLTAELGERVQLVGGELFANSAERLASGARARCANAVAIDADRVVTLTAALDLARAARDAGLRVVVARRSGGTSEAALADLAVAACADQIDAGPPSLAGRTGVYERIGEIAAELGVSAAPYAGKRAFAALSKG
jgi:enolase